MKYKAILFDMDGTLVPMDLEELTKGYLALLYRKLAPLRISQDSYIKAMWAGVEVMMKNDGKQKNEVLFWNTFEQITGVKKETVADICEDFYRGEYNKAKIYTQENPHAKEAVQLAHQKAPHVVLATNPYFPMSAQVARVGWVNLSENDFDFITSYETDSYCKPNPKYYLSICERLGLKPMECLMIGNDEKEDMYAGTLAGLECYLVTDNLIECKEHPWHGRKGSFNDLIDYLKTL